MIKTAQLISTAIMKTDIIGFSNIIGELSDFELSKLLEEHKEFIIRIVYKYNGSIIKGEGDAFLISFSSSTSATESAIEIQKKLRKMREGSDDKFRLSLRIIISLGDVMHKNNDVYGESVNLIARIENITPPDEIYLSEPVSLTLRKKNINVEFVGEYEFKGFSEKQKIYRIVLGRKVIIADNQYSLLSDMEGIRKLFSSKNYDLIEKHIDNQDIMFQNVIRKYNGSLRNVVGDAYIITFINIFDLINAINYIHDYWSKACREYGLNKMRLGCHKGELYMYRSLLGGEIINLSARLESAGINLSEYNNKHIHVITHTSGVIRDEAIEFDNKIKSNFRKVLKKEIIDKLLPKQKQAFIKDFNNCTYSYIIS